VKILPSTYHLQAKESTSLSISGEKKLKHSVYSIVRLRRKRRRRKEKL
jgi:hypothetical protein